MQNIINIYKNKKKLISNFFWRSSQVFFKQGTNFLIFILCSKLLIPVEFGIFNYIISFVLILISFSDFGISIAASKFVTQWHLTETKKFKSILFNSSLLIIFLSALVSVVVLIFGSSYFGEKFIYIAYSLPLVFLIPIVSLYDGLYRGLKKFKTLSIISFFSSLLGLLLVYPLIKEYGLLGAIIVQNIFYLILFIALALGWGKENEFKFNKEIIFDIIKYSSIIGIGSLGFILYSRIDLIFLGHFNYFQEINYFEISNKILMIVIIPMTIFSQVIFPEIVELYVKKDFKKIKSEFNTYLLISLIVSLIVVFGLFIFSKTLLSLVFPMYYNDSLVLVFNLLLIVYFTQILNGIIPTGFAVATHDAKLITYVLFVSGIIHVILNYILIIKYGYIGVVYSIILTRVITDFFFLYSYRKILNRKIELVI